MKKTLLASALVLAVVYLLEPPIEDAAIDYDAPLGRWNQAQTFSSPESCEQARGERERMARTIHTRMLNEYVKEHPEEAARRFNSIEDHLRWAAKHKTLGPPLLIWAASVSARCVASDDPRLR